MDCRTDGSWVASCDCKSVSRAQLSAWTKDLGSIGLPDFVLGSWPQHPPSAQSPVSEEWAHTCSLLETVTGLRDTLALLCGLEWISSA